MEHSPLASLLFSASSDIVKGDLFANSTAGQLVPTAGVDPGRGEWSHAAFVPHPLPPESPELSGATYRAVADARASLAALDSTARSLPNPRLFRQTTLRVEAQSTAALEGTYEPLMKVLAADDNAEKDPLLREVLNYLVVAEAAFEWSQERRALTVSMLGQLQERLMEGTRHVTPETGHVRDVQVVIGRRPDADLTELPIKAAPFVPSPPGPDLVARLGDLLDWMSPAHSSTTSPPAAMTWTTARKPSGTLGSPLIAADASRSPAGSHVAATSGKSGSLSRFHQKTRHTTSTPKNNSLWPARFSTNLTAPASKTVPPPA